jgi:2-polyprenyl-3-methyl-5-hydroxy-6-metoxy-1,4-benzoquinol methylase
LSAEDYTVSHRPFEIWQCAGCTLRFTQDAPDAASAGDFYQSDNYISHTDTDKGLVNKLYHFVRKTTLQRKRKLVAQTTGLLRGTVLDIGAGTGAFAYTMQQAGWQVAALEPDAATRQRAAELYAIQLKNIDALYTLPAAGFDAITMWHVLEHVHDLQACIAQIKLLLKPGGKVLIAVPNYTSKDASIYRQYWAAYDVPRHLYHFSPASIKKLLAMHNLQLQGMRPMWYDSFYISMLSETYKNGKNNFVKAVWNGLRSNLAALWNKERCSSVIYIISK